MRTPRALALSLAALLACVALLASVACERNATITGPDAPEPPSTESPTGPQTLATLVFYNVENLFDTEDDRDNELDDEFLAEADKRWTPERYTAKIAALARVIGDLAVEEVPGGPALVGLAEVENARVLRDLTAAIAEAGPAYDIAHFDSPDFRGIDNALLYQPALFTPLYSAPVAVSLPPREGSTKRRTTRDILYVKGLLGGDTLHYFVNHWPSRGGGEVESRPGRFEVARVLRGLVDSIAAVVPDADVVIGGDLNDDPDDESVVRVLGSAPRRDLASATLLYNPFAALHERGEGTLGFRRAWNLFDQLLFSEGLARHGGDWSVRDVQIFKPDYLLQDSGSYAGFPERTYVGDDYRGGYSDHLPVYAVLQRER